MRAEKEPDKVRGKKLKYADSGAEKCRMQKEGRRDEREWRIRSFNSA